MRLTRSDVVRAMADQTEFMDAAQFDHGLEALDNLIDEYASYDGGSGSSMKEPTRTVPVV